MSCADLLSSPEQWNAAYDACWEQAKARVPVTKSVRTFCEAYTLAEFDCRYWYATEECERDFGMWSERIRNTVAACAMNPSCSEAEECVAAVFRTQ
ncbi:MAG TPA: hypothetical protein VFQ35_24400 [Polyangiaceae bacterium]|nr:hypothetical protein [Polyangiaceae bacterium]